MVGQNLHSLKINMNLFFWYYWDFRSNMHDLRINSERGHRLVSGTAMCKVALSLSVSAKDSDSGSVRGRQVDCPRTNSHEKSHNKMYAMGYGYPY